MYSTLQRLNHISSLATTYVMILLGLISIASFLSLPSVDVGKVEIKDLIVQKGRLRRWGARQEELASLKFDIRTDLNPLLNSYNTKQLFIYLTASYEEQSTGHTHDVVLWDRIIQRAEIRDIRAEAKNKYQWRNPSGTFKNVEYANMTLHYSLMPYVGILSSGVAATAQGPVTIPELIKR
ncbi:signal peptidase [Kwoniella mangroviensis CBS 10435]|uniref:Signal peptidase subunit 3 n=1 Tax=Kwoniella mangroviensis CBS 10435 TaxID=1331196 RepID=A0A1B9IN64_9TREE|nr:signal peptidase [Kwoniella mangroviensis CBS 8507]OCF57036.1 signal peptidase [Kwoniella mangroviensis CBS 10435]OCF67473.1 signal peptidase [Kwoniella mangroviensis CBS 8507]OCF72719.1 signal peptidase [Kwoniella mangroviensis CBS 8886]